MKFSYKALYPYLCCAECQFDVLVTIYGEVHLNKHYKGQVWYDTEFTQRFANMMTHINHVVGGGTPEKNGERRREFR
jgi:hypothetical protein